MSRNLTYTLILIILQCWGCAPKSTAKLASFTEKLVDMYIDAGHVHYDNLIMLYGYSSENYASITILNPIPEVPPAGLYNGVVYYRGAQIVLYGDSWNGFFWESFQDPVLVTNNADTLFYDPCEWYINVFIKDTTIERWTSQFSCTFPYSLDTLDCIIK